MGVQNNKRTPRVAVIGGGIAGLSAAIHLAESGISVKLFERLDLFGGKLKGWDTLLPGEHTGKTQPVEHGMHGWWTHYHNFKAFFERTQAHGNGKEGPALVPVRRIWWVDALRLTPQGRGRWEVDKELLDATLALTSFRGLLGLLNPCRWCLHLRILRMGLDLFSIGDLMRIGIIALGLRFRWFSGFLGRTSSGYRNLFAFMSPNPPEWLDQFTVRQLTDSAPFGKGVSGILDVTTSGGTYGRSDQQSAYHVAHIFDLYGLRSSDAIWFDMCQDSAHADGVWPLVKHAEKVGVTLCTYSPVTRMDPQEVQGEAHWMVHTNSQQPQQFDYVILALDISGAKRLLAECESPKLAKLKKDIAKQRVNQMTVLRIWFRKKIDGATHPPPALALSSAEKAGCPFDFLFIPSRFQVRAKQAPGEVIEVHISYSERYKDQTKEELVNEVLKWILRLFPELQDENDDPILHTAFSEVRNYSSVPAFHLQHTPSISGEVPGLYLCGDWIRWDSSIVYMEKAFVTGMAAAGEICRKEGRSEPVILPLPER